MANSRQEDGPKYKRRRVALACKSCRTRKTRCNGARPECLSCVELGLTCTYEQPEHRDAENEREQLRDSRLEALEDTIRQLVDSMKAGQPLPGINNETVTMAVNNSSMDQIHDEENISSEEEVTDGMASITGDTANARRYFGPSSNIAFLRGVSLATGAVLRHLRRRDRNSRLPNESLLAPGTAQSDVPATPDSALPVQTVDAWALPREEQAKGLIDSFFNDTGLLFPYVHEKYIRSRFSYVKSRGAQGMSSHFLALLNAVFAMAAHIHNAADPDSLASRTGFDAETFFVRARLLLSRSHRPTVERVQCLLLMCQYRQGTNKADETGALHAEATRIAIQLGLHVEQLPWSGSSLETETRIRTWSNCIMLDRVLSMTFGRPQLINKDLVLQINPQDLGQLATTGGTDSSSSTVQLESHSGCFFVATSKLYMILSEILTTMYGDNTQLDFEQDLTELIKLGISFERQLFTWKRDLPPSLTLQPWLENSSECSGRNTSLPVLAKLSTVLQLRYLNICILKDRPILTWLLKCIYGPARDGFVPAAVDMHFMDLAQTVLGRIERNARDAVDVIWAMSNTFQALGAWWFSNYYLLNSCLVLFGCFLVRTMNELEHRPQTSRAEQLTGLETSLRKGVDASRKIVKIRGKTSRIQETLDRISNIAVAISSTLQPPSDSGQYASPSSQTPSRRTPVPARTGPSYRSPRSYESQPSAYGSQTVPFEMVGPHLTPDDLTQLFSGDVDIFDTLGDMNFDFNDFTAL